MITSSLLQSGCDSYALSILDAITIVQCIGGIETKLAIERAWKTDAAA